jgi:FHS family L-fucose permease-like MFS transporter
LGIFFYVGVEVGLASIAVNYFSSQGMSTAKTASFLVSLYWLGALVGRVLGAGIMTKVNAGKLLGIFGLTAAILITVSMFTSGSVAIGTLVLCGFFNSVMFPNIFTLGIAGLGPMTSKGSGLIMSAVVGGAVIPWLIGEVADKVGKHYAIIHSFQYVPGGLADKIGIQTSFIIPIICYLYIAFYGFIGHKPTRTVTA